MVRLAPGHAAAGTLVSEVHDTKLVSRFGSLTWHADLPPGTSISFETRTGNVGEPDETWSAWSASQSDPADRHDRVAAGSVHPVSGQALHDRPAAYARAALGVARATARRTWRPRSRRLDVPDLSTADGAARQTRLNLRWDATDPNDDDLNFHAQGPQGRLARVDRALRRADHGEDFRLGHDRVSLGDAIGSSSLASDRPSNSPDDALTRDRESVTFIVDHDPPAVKVTPRKSGAAIVLKDELTRLVKADYALDGGRWVPIFPDDGLFDTVHEKITLSLPDLKPGTHLSWCVPPIRPAMLAQAMRSIEVEK